MNNVGTLLAEQVDRAKAKRQANPVVTLVAELPGDGSQVSLDWWLRELNSKLHASGVTLDFADDAVRMVDRNDVDPIRVANLQRQLAEAKLYIADLEEHLEEKIEEGIQEKIGNQAHGVTNENLARCTVEEQGYFVDEHGAKWVDIRTEANRIGASYIKLWRTAKGLVQSASIDSWVVGSTNANGDRLLVKQGSYVRAKRGKSS